MARHAEGWKLKPDTRTGIQCVRFTHEGRRYDLSTGTRNAEEATQRAPEIYTAIVSGKRPEVAKTSNGGTSLDSIAAKWLVAYEADHDATTVAQYAIYVRAFWQPHFKTIEGITTGTGDTYWRERLGSVLRKTVLKEMSALRRFCDWMVDQHYLTEAPVLRSPPKHATGTASKRTTMKRNATVLDPKQVKRFLNALPELTEGKPGQPASCIRVRDRFIVAYETGLRPGTLDALRAPEHFKKGAQKLTITAAIDKARFARQLPLTEAARAALDRCTPDIGPIFGTHDYRPFILAAAKRVGLDKETAERFTSYDLRHTRGTHLVERTGDIVGAAYLLGHKHVTTTAERYVHPSERAALKTLAVVSGKVRRINP